MWVWCVFEMTQTVYYLTGMGGRLHTGLGHALTERGCIVLGRELFGDFKKLGFQQQVDAVASDLERELWHEDTHVIANSFGAYLFLHAQAQLPPYVGRVILLSPIVGEFGNEETQMNFIPPRADKLLELARAGNFPVPKQCQVHVGSEDWQSNPANVKAFGELLGIDVTTVSNAGHMLPKEYVGALLDRWL